MKKIKVLKRVIPILCATLLLLGSSMTVFAYSGNPKYSDLVYPSDYTNLGYEYYLEANANYWMFVTSEKPLYFNKENSDTDGLYVESGSAVVYLVNSKGELYNGYKYINGFSHSNYLYVDFIYASSDVYDINTGKVFFYHPLVMLAIPLTATIQNQTAKILPIAVGCLALLIGSITLLPRLRMFLVR